jgi:hypothetical protein
MSKSEYKILGPAQPGNAGGHTNGAYSSNGSRRPRAMDEDALGIVGIIPPLVPDREWSGGFVRKEEGRFAQRERYFLWFRITTPGEYFAEEVYLSCPCPKSFQPKKSKFGLGSKLVAAYTVANGNRRPRKGDTLDLKLFKGKLFRFSTRTVKKDSEGNVRPSDEWYSVIDKLIAVEAGGT